MDRDTVIKVEHVSKKYCKSLKRSMVYGLMDIGRNMIGMRSKSEHLRKEEFWALDDVSFEVKRGETLGIIGPNGSGKTTLLKLLNGIFWPDKGKITIKGRVGALIELGAGFHPMLTGRENIYINAAILGMTKKEVDKKYDEIVEFADIGNFIDTPVKYYSSGMFVRLGFAVAIHCNPDILIVDEVLAVGDVRFWTKSINKMKNLNNLGMTIVVVTHNMWIAQTFCNRCICLNKGKIIFDGEPFKTINIYKNISEKNLEENIKEHDLHKGKATITLFEIFPQGEWASEKEAYPESGIKVFIKAKINGFHKIMFLLRATSHDGFPYFTVYSNEFSVLNDREIECLCFIKNFMLIPGNYIIWCAICSEKGEEEILAEEKFSLSIVPIKNKIKHIGIFYNKAIWEIK